MNRRRLFCIFIFCLVIIGCKKNESKNQLNIVGDWYVCQYWGEEKIEEIDVYESESGNIRIVEQPDKTQIKHWDNNYNYGENIISFKENQSMLVNIKDFEFVKYVSYILDIENSKLICIKGNNKDIYNLLEESNTIVLSREHDETHLGNYENYVDLGLQESGLKHTKTNSNKKTNIKLKRIN